MKTAQRIFLLVLILTHAISALTSCNTGKDTETEQDSKTPSEALGTETESETEVEYLPEIERNNYDTDFFLSIMPTASFMEYHWVKESSNDAMSQAIYDRQQKVREYLGVNLIGTATEASLHYAEPFKAAVKNKDGSVDALMTHQYHGIDGFISGNYLAQYNDYSQIDITGDHWYTQIMEDVAIGGRMYLGMSQYNILRAFVVAFNKDMMDKYGDALDESVYDMVYNYRWTLDKMISLANLVYIDATGDGKTLDDTFGISAEHNAPFSSFPLAFDIQMISPNEKGDYVLSIYNDVNRAKTTDIVDKLRNLASSNCAWFWKYQSSETLNLPSGRVLMTLCSSYQLPYFTTQDISFGVLPYPMYDENQKDVGYRTLQWGGYLCIPSYVANPQMVGDTVEVMSFFSQNVNTTFYEKILGKQASESPDDTKMLEIVWDGIGTDFTQTFYSIYMDTQIFHVIPNVTYPDAQENIASFIARTESSINKKISKFITLVEKTSN
ncbi:MAG: hypothetical protein J6B12_00245 [Clostridia bacterium]|nr:hypothetical protein [Clostridia bacterium]